MKLKFGFIGVGAMGLSHVNSFARLCGDNVEIAAVCTSNKATLKKVHDVAPHAKCFENERDLIDSPLDAIVVSTPNFTHAKLAEEILAARKHLFLEKPIGITVDECKRVIAACEQSDRIVMVGHE